jgi:hypothetical protein
MQEFAGQSTTGAEQKEGAAGLQTLSGVQQLETGDILIRTAGIVTLVTPAGDRIVIDADGKLSIEGKVVGADRNKEGVSSICFKDDAIVKVDKHGLLEIHRNGHVLKFPRKEEATNSAETGVHAEPAGQEVARQVEPVKVQAPEQTKSVERAARPQVPQAPQMRAAEPASKRQAAPSADAPSKKWSIPSYQLPGLDISL